VTTSIGVDDLPDVAVGQRATIQPDGSAKPTTGRIVAIGLSGTSTSSTTTYPVIVGLDGDTSTLRNGSLATVTIVTKSSAAKLAVPTSAVATTGDNHTVRVVDGSGDPKTVNVGIGAVGRTWAEITSGLTAGQRVVIADLGEPLPGSATASANGNNNGGFFPRGGTFRGGGFRVPNR
jgi:HlyD family secretion protein